MAMTDGFYLHHLDFLHRSGHEDQRGAPACALLVLNTELDKNCLVALLRASDTVVLADGAANRVHDALKGTETTEDLRAHLKPTAIKGDLDSLRPDVAAFYGDDCGVPILKDANPDRNDMDKCLDLIWARHCDAGLAAGEAPAVVPRPGVDVTEAPARVAVRILGSFGGRFDQLMASFHCLQRWTGAFDAGLAMVAHDNAAVMLRPGLNKVLMDQILATKVCGLLPIGQPCRSLRTANLRWNLDGQRLAFGEFISSSNEVSQIGEVVEVEASDAIVFSTELDPLIWPPWQRPLDPNRGGAGTDSDTVHAGLLG